MDITVEDVGVVRHRVFVGGKCAFAIFARRSAAVSDDNLVQNVGLRGRRYQDQDSPDGDHRLQNTYGIPHDAPVSMKYGGRIKTVTWRGEASKAANPECVRAVSRPHQFELGIGRNVIKSCCRRPSRERNLSKPSEESDAAAPQIVSGATLL